MSRIDNHAAWFDQHARRFSCGCRYVLVVDGADDYDEEIEVVAHCPFHDPYVIEADEAERDFFDALHGDEAAMFERRSA